MSDRLSASIQRLAPDLVEIRRQIHSHPELGFHEHETRSRNGAVSLQANRAKRTFSGEGSDECGTSRTSLRRE